ncbi:hypothetical protein [Pengzhenrongella sicca]|uniref:Uncharacterized protein n=1 Tax=Pengzhenrongella sicca TaxID=2819238 RepID=A0A8A4ZAF8_9MICO|nr:hypothetical protein [Pengzhenrongella sicca]QTE28425.1 hypothetical protein J4E96_13690 [Pengzhenrongella sicca]
MTTVSGFRTALGAITGRRTPPPPARDDGGARHNPAPSIDAQRDALAEVLYLAEQGFWDDGRRSPFGTAWSTSTDRYLRGRYLDQADAILAAGFRQPPRLERTEIETALRSEGSGTDADDWIVVAWALGIDVRAQD